MPDIFSTGKKAGSLFRVEADKKGDLLKEQKKKTNEMHSKKRMGMKSKKRKTSRRKAFKY